MGSAVALLLSLVAVACGGGIPRLLLTSHALPLADVPDALRSNVEKWRSLNPTFRFEYFDDAAQAAFMASSCAAPRCAEAYGALRSGAGRADLFRVAFLYYRGGWWFDADLKPGDVAASCGLEAAEDLGLFVVREPKHGHVRFMVLGGAGHPLLYATLLTQIANVFEARALPPAKRPRTLHVTGPFTLGRTLCDPFRHAPMADALERGFDAAAVAAVADAAANCDRGAFRGAAPSSAATTPPRRRPAPVDGAVRSPAGAVRGARGAGMATTGELEGDLRYIIPGRFAWCCIPERILARDPEPKIAGARCFCTDSTFVYEQFFADFGPLNLGCVVRYCRATAELLQRCGDEKLVLVHYCSDHRHRRTNAAFLACAFAVVALRWSVRRAYAPFVDCSPPLHPFRDAGFGVHIAPGVHTFAPEDYVPLFQRLGVTCVVRFNKKLYDKRAFTRAGIRHVELFYEDGGNPSEQIMQRFIQVCEQEPGAIAVHCKAGLGRTGTNIGAYMMKHWGYSATECMGWMRVCRPGSVIGPQQQFILDAEDRLWREGDIFRRQRGNWPEQPLPDHAARSDAAPAAYLPAAVPAPLSNARGHPSSRKAGRDTHDNSVQGNGRRRTTG
ncbi:protein tyrosine/serine/threonine phosphatase [Aureococcus anophagefferens]|nr:protein tyrosine/serine/threonine phosphatase [Aureococcus anophagefferens]